MSRTSAPRGWNLGTLRLLFLHELRQLLRDRKTLALSILLPLLVMPAMLWSSRVTTQAREGALSSMNYHYALDGSEATWLRGLLSANPKRGAAVGPGSYGFEEKMPASTAKALASGEIHCLVFVRSAAEARALRAKQPPDAGTTDAAENLVDDAAGGLPPGPAVPELEIRYRSSDDASRSGARKFEEWLQQIRDDERGRLLQARGFPLPTAQVWPAARVDLASPAAASGSSLGRFLTLLVVFLAFSGGSVVAIDIVSGEKERGTLETLLTTAAGRREVIAAKQLTVLVVALLITLLQVANLLIYVGFGWVPLPAGWSAALDVPTIVTLIFLLIPVAALVSSVLLFISAIARSYKEAQLYFMPVFLLGLVPAAAAFFPGIALRSAIVLVPLANISIAVREVLVGRFDWPMLALAIAITVSAASWVMRQGAAALLSERIVAGIERDAIDVEGGPASFPRHVVRWFAVIWVVLFVVASNVTALQGVREQVVFNIGFLFVGGSLLMLRWFRLPAREALALRAPHPAAWLAVLVGAPAGLLTATGIFRMLNVVLPVPTETIEAFGKAMVGEQLTLPAMILFLAVIPALGEEIAFRGLLFHGLARRLRPAMLCLAVGLIFGLFHVSLFRIAPTAFLGILLSACLVLTGSIYTCMAWHFLNNALGLLAADGGIDIGDLPPGYYFAAAVVLAFCLGILWRCRTPYPGLRWKTVRSAA